ncbi:MAG: hypothetical protein IT379_06795 [Deltaproteobacteria bacterium]|nr:hypothetical protein [Deltaproteobacteria bacterium]
MPEPPPPRKSKRPLPSPDESPIGFALEPVGWDDDDEQEEITQATDPLRKDDSGPRPKLDAAHLDRILGPVVSDDDRPTHPDSRAARAAHTPISSRPAPASAPRPATGRPVTTSTPSSRAGTSAVTLTGHANPLDRLAPLVDAARRTPMRLEPPPVVSPIRSAETAVVGTPVPSDDDRWQASEAPSPSAPAPQAATPEPEAPRAAPSSGPHAIAPAPAAPRASSGPHAVASPADAPPATMSSGPHAVHDPSIPPPTVDWSQIGSRVRDEVRAAVTDLGAPPRYASSTSTSTTLVVAVVCSLVGGVVGSGATLLLAGAPTRPAAPRSESSPSVRQDREIGAPSSDPLALTAAPTPAAPTPSADDTAPADPPANEPRSPSTQGADATAIAPVVPSAVAAGSAPQAAADSDESTQPARAGRLTPRQLAMRRRMAELRRQRIALARAASRAQTVSASASDAPAAPAPAPAPAAAPATAPAVP